MVYDREVYGAGNVVAGKSRIERMLGQGGMGYVVAATHLDLGTPVALKFLHEHMLENQSVVDRFKREAKTAANLGHPHIVPIFTVRESPGILFFVMKYVEGRPLDSVIREMGQLPFDMVRTAVSQGGNALDYAPRKGVMPRDG